MKKLMIAFLLLFTPLAFAQNFTFQDLQGLYEITHPEIPVTNIIEINADGTVFFIESSPMGEFSCEGEATLKNNIIESSMKCENGAEFSQQVDLTEVTDLNEFSAPVFSSLYGATLEMDFVKEQD